MPTEKSLLTLMLIELSLLLCLAFGSPVPSDNIYYLSLGDSYAAGVDPTINGHISPTYSYADALYGLLKKDHDNLKLIKYACSGVTSDGVIKEDLCNKNNTNYSQLDQAVDFMKSNKGLVKFVTIIVGTNDLHVCEDDNDKCNSKVLDKISNNLNKVIIPKLKEAGGESVIYAGSTYYNPSRNSLDDRLLTVYHANGFKVADMRTIFDTNNTAEYKTNLCFYTNYCDKYHDSHPNVIGSYLIGDQHYKVLTSINIQ
jgi:hypothetical protein